MDKSALADTPQAENTYAERIFKLQREINFLDMLVRIGEEPWEISYEVDRTAKTCATLYEEWLRRERSGTDLDMFLNVVEPFFHSTLFSKIYLWPVKSQ